LLFQLLFVEVEIAGVPVGLDCPYTHIGSEVFQRSGGSFDIIDIVPE
jgi:hypothetical protein